MKKKLKKIFKSCLGYTQWWFVLFQFTFFISSYNPRLAANRMLDKINDSIVVWYRILLVTVLLSSLIDQKIIIIIIKGVIYIKSVRRWSSIIRPTPQRNREHKINFADLRSRINHKIITNLFHCIGNFFSIHYMYINPFKTLFVISSLYL